MGLPPPEPSTSSSSSSSKLPPTPAPAAPPPKPADPFADYTTAASLGIRDEAAERAAAEVERRQNEGVIGEWQKVVKPRPPPPGDVKGKRRAATTVGARESEEGFAGRAVLKPELAGVKLEARDGVEVGPFSSVERKPTPPAAATSAARASDEDEDDPTLSVVERARKRGFLSEKSALGAGDSDSDDDPLAKLGPIKLKKQRLTVKEQRAEEEARLARQREVEEVLRAREESRRRVGRTNGWEQLDRNALLEEAQGDGFDPLAPTEGTEGADGGAAGEELAATAGRQEHDDEPTPREEKKPSPPAGLFKKRKRPGAAKPK